jgi:hypothetical protein
VLRRFTTAMSQPVQRKILDLNTKRMDGYAKENEVHFTGNMQEKAVRISFDRKVEIFRHKYL